MVDINMILIGKNCGGRVPGSPVAESCLLRKLAGRMIDPTVSLEMDDAMLHDLLIV